MIGSVLWDCTLCKTENEEALQGLRWINLLFLLPPVVNLLLWWLRKATQLSEASIKAKQLATCFLSACHTASVHAALHQLQLTAVNSFQSSSSPLSHMPLLLSMAKRLLCYCSTACLLILHGRNQFTISVLFETWSALAGRTFLLLEKEWIGRLEMGATTSLGLGSLMWGISTEGQTQDLEVFGRNLEILRLKGLWKCKAVLFFPGYWMQVTHQAKEHFTNPHWPYVKSMNRDRTLTGCKWAGFRQLESGAVWVSLH